MSVDDLRAAVRDIADFPQQGIIFKDISPILADPNLFRMSVDLFADRHAVNEIDYIAVIEARGFIFGSALAYKLGAGLIPIRKEGKLPYQTISTTYDLEYGSATLEVHVDAVREGSRVLIIDDLLATGGTAAASAKMVEQVGGQVAEIDFLIELSFLEGRKKLSEYEVYAPIVF